MPFSIPHRVQFSETDIARVVHFSNYFKGMEEIEHAFFRSLGLSVVMEKISWPRIATSCEYLLPARFEDEVTLVLRVTRVGGKSLSYEVDFLIAGQAAAKGQLTSVCCAVSPQGFSAMAIPPAIREKLAAAG